MVVRLGEKKLWLKGWVIRSCGCKVGREEAVVVRLRVKKLWL